MIPSPIGAARGRAYLVAGHATLTLGVAGVIACGAAPAPRTSQGAGSHDRAEAVGPGPALVASVDTSGPVITLHPDGGYLSGPGVVETAPNPDGDALRRVAMTWRIHYLLILEPRPPWHMTSSASPTGPRIAGWLHATVEVTNQSERALPEATYLLADVPLAQGQDSDQDRARAHIRVPGTFALGPGETRSVPLVAAPSASAPVLVEATPGLLYDPIDSPTIHPYAMPVVRRPHGLERSAITHPEVHHGLILDLESARLGPLPRGELAVFQRQGDGELLALGVDQEFGLSDFGDLELGPGTQPDGDHADVRLGLARGVTGTRRQTDFALDLSSHRLVEEIRVELDNQTDQAQRVIVREHLYRGRNWTIVYHNEVGEPRKIAPQTIRFEVPLEPRTSARIVYRVAYTWTGP